MGDRGHELSHGGDAACVRKLRLYFAIALLAVACFGFRPLALGQIEYESNTFLSAFFEARRADQHGHTAAVFPEILLLERLHGSGPLQLFNGLCIAPAPFRRRQVRPAWATGHEILRG